MKELNENIYKVEIERESPHDRFFCVFFCSFVSYDIHSLDTLCIVGSESSENHDTDARDDEIELTIPHPDIHDTGDYYTDETHQSYATKPTEVIFCEKTIETHKSKHPRCYEEYISNRRHGVDEENRGECDACSETIEQEYKYSGRR